MIHLSLLKSFGASGKSRNALKSGYRFTRLPVIALAVAGMLASPASAIDLFGGQKSQQPVLMAQAGDSGVRLSQLEEEIRRLTGKVEEMSFLVLQLQEQLRNAQEDNNLRFQDLEGGGGGAAPQRQGNASPQPGSSGDQDFALGAGEPAPSQDDEIAGMLSAGLNENTFQNAPQPATQAPPAEASSMYNQGYNYLLSGDYVRAEETFRQYTQAYPTSENSADAQYWLGESLFAQEKYRDAAEVFLNAQKQFGTSAKAPEMLLKLGMSLARLENRDTACATYAEVERRYPQINDNIKRKLQSEEQASKCS
ncbi:tol-pal system protein YbgF [Aureimonas fodinaquatilis]|uniref:Cell division coordinator CpoB n=1 Tax=Aureimonas fodinaquatilis TaxID=2565783 RepID=A0A5B0DZ62_9HYPH|nr:tol-pal system protein YbgF [Aureimonas fodinaquatilis]KAA0971135.1 tol-pal system protein YbgF [Aureimonas fodinaquatilis]